MVLKPGRYQIRYVPVAQQPPFLGGLYATSTEINEPLLAEPNPNAPQVVGAIVIYSVNQRFNFSMPSGKLSAKTTETLSSTNLASNLSWQE
jgi:hypothetical protein